MYAMTLLQICRHVMKFMQSWCTCQRHVRMTCASDNNIHAMICIHEFHDILLCSRMYACHLCVCAKRDREYSHACRQGHTRTAKRPNMPRSIRHSQSSLTAPVCMRESASRCSSRVFMWPWVPLGLISIVV